MSIFKNFTKDSLPDADMPVILYNEQENTYECINEFSFDKSYYYYTGEIREWMGESKSSGQIYHYYPNDIKWCYMEDIVDKFFSRLGVKRD